MAFNSAMITAVICVKIAARLVGDRISGLHIDRSCDARADGNAVAPAELKRLIAEQVSISRRADGHAQGMLAFRYGDPAIH